MAPPTPFPGVPGSGPALDVDPQRIVLADDVADARELYGAYLEVCGFAVTVVENGAELLRAVRELRPALVITDLTMPVMDGVTAATALRRDAQTRGLRIVALTAVDPRELPLHAAALFDAYVVKPCAPDALEEVVRSVLQPAAARAS